MRISKLPIPLLVAAAALTGVAVIYVYLTAPPMPIHTDPNFTSPLFVGGVYLWRGAAFQYLLSADKIISVSHAPGYHLIYTNGPLTNITIGDRIWIVYLRGGRPLYVEKRWIDWYPPDGRSGYWYLVYKIEDVTPPNCTIPDLTMWLPQTFGPTEYLSQNEMDAIMRILGNPWAVARVLAVEVNGTHIIYRTGYPYIDLQQQLFARLSSPTTGTTIRVTNRPFGSSYTVNGTTFSATALPYQFFSISPSETTRLVIYVS
jgi:hypothetical protein